jgi:hypothetical protein
VKVKKKAMIEEIKQELYLRQTKTKDVLDAVQEKLISRKLLVFLTATGLMYWSDLDPETWGMIAVMYITGQSVIDAVKAWRWGGQ